MKFSKEAQIVIRYEPVTEREIGEAFNVSAAHPLFKAVKQIIIDAIDVSQSNAGSACEENNPLACAACNGAVHILKQLLADFEKRRQDANKQ